jgi:hypothetical protein
VSNFRLHRNGGIRPNTSQYVFPQKPFSVTVAHAAECAHGTLECLRSRQFDALNLAHSLTIYITFTLKALRVALESPNKASNEVEENDNSTLQRDCMSNEAILWRVSDKRSRYGATIKFNWLIPLD